MLILQIKIHFWQEKNIFTVKLYDYHFHFLIFITIVVVSSAIIIIFASAITHYIHLYCIVHHLIINYGYKHVCLNGFSLQNYTHILITNLKWSFWKGRIIIRFVTCDLWLIIKNKMSFWTFKFRNFNSHQQLNDSQMVSFDVN